MGRAHEGRSAADCRSKSRSAPYRPQNVAGTQPMSASHCSSPSGLPTSCGASFSTLPESTSFIVQLRAPACSPTCIPQPFSHCTQYTVSPFTFVLQRAHLPAFHRPFSRCTQYRFTVHFRAPVCLPACIPQPFSHCTQYRFTVHLRAPACSPACVPQPFSHCTQHTVSPFTFVHQRARLPAFHSHFLVAHNTGSPFTFVLRCAHLPAFHSGPCFRSESRIRLLIPAHSGSYQD